MIRPARTWRLAAVLGVATLTLAACGGDDPEATPTASESESSASEPAAEGDGELVVGTLLPQTGSLASLGPPEFAGVQLAIDEINEAGGVLGQPVRKVDSDSGDTSTDIASQSTDRLLSEGADVIVGAASSSVTKTVIDAITTAGVLQISPANTSADLTTYDDNGLYFRTAPSDVLQGAVMGDLVLGDGYVNVGILQLDDEYAIGLGDSVAESIEAGGGTVAGRVTYGPDTDFSAEVTEMSGYAPDAIVFIGFAETAKGIPALAAQGIGPQEVPLYLVDGNIDDYSGDLPDGLLDGSKATLPGADVGDEFQQRLLGVDPSLTVFSYGPEAYDATIITALAAVAAENDSGEAIAAALPDVTREGEKCTTFADCLALLEAGTDIDYDGVSGPIEFSDAGDPTEASIGIYQYGPDNRYTNVEYVQRAID